MELSALLSDGAVAAPDQPLVLTLDRSITYAEAAARADAFARGLLAREIDRFACVVTDPSDVIALLCGSSRVGSEACVYPTETDEALIDYYMQTFEQEVIVANRPLDVANAEVVAVDDLADDRGVLPPPGERSPALILTTGTTGTPRGVRHDWHRLVAATRNIGPSPDARWLLAYNLNQFAGTQILLHVLRSRSTLVAAPSARTRDVLETIRALGVTHVSATPTFWRMLIADLDAETAATLPIEQITLGGEAAPGGLLDRLAALFPVAKISHVYAGSEFGSVGSVRDSKSGMPLSILDRGDDADVQLRIVDGELHIRSRVGMLGYYGEPDVGDEWRPTGDLVTVEGDRILFVGRTTDIINVGGVKVHPFPIEDATRMVEGVELVRAFGRASPVTGQIVALEVVAAPGADRERIEKEIRDACSTLIPAAQPRSIRFVDSIDMRGHKIVRMQKR